jgi:hypothetical protein
MKPSRSQTQFLSFSVLLKLNFQNHYLVFPLTTNRTLNYDGSREMKRSQVCAQLCLAFVAVITQ